MIVKGYVLSGGLSSRMGTDKAMLQWDGRTLLEHAMQKLQAACGNAAILCGSPERASQLARYGRCVPDRVPGRGPLSGIDAALHDSTAPRVLIVAVDTPLLSVALLVDLLRHPAAMFSVDGFAHPLPVVLPRDFAEPVSRALAMDALKLMPLLQQLDVPTIPVEDASVFANLNTPEEFARARARMRSHANQIR